MFPRVREIIHSNGERLRVSVHACSGGAVTVIEHPVRRGSGQVMLDAVGVELLGGYLMSARLALPAGLPEERMIGSLGASFQLDLEPEPCIHIRQDGGRAVEIPACFWDKLYAELCLVVAHSRERPRLEPVQLH